VLIQADGKRTVTDPVRLPVQVAHGAAGALAREGFVTGGEYQFPENVRKVRVVVRGLRSLAIGRRRSN